MTTSICAWATLFAVASASPLNCPEPIFHAGKVRSGITLRHRFILINQGSQPLRLLQLKPGCGCLKASVERMSLAPSQQACVEVEIGTVTQPPGPNRWRVTVHHERGELPLEILADLERDLTIEPASLLLHVGSTISHSFRLSERRARPIVVTSATCASPHIRLFVGPATRQGELWTRNLRLEVLPTFPEGRLEDVLLVRTEDSTCPELKVPLTIVKRSPQKVVATPAEVSMPGTGPFPARVLLLSAGDAKVLVQRVETSHPALRCTFCEGPGERSTVRVTLDHQKLPPGPFQGELRILLETPPQQIVLVPVRAPR